MAEFPAMPLFTDAFIADTTHLTAAESGAYMMLLMCAWRRPNCDLPMDDKTLARITRMSLLAWLNIKENILWFWSNDGSAYRHIDWRAHPSVWPDGKWHVVRAAVIDRDHGVCAYCGKIPDVPDVDHIFPKVRGGDNSAENLTTSCPSCNRSKGARTPYEWNRSK